jgi:hypothetical protein
VSMFARTSGLARSVSTTTLIAAATPPNWS